ncbi:tetratricopeptide repeat protein [Lachnobacterium bovis]|uniref:Tetratricopeptide repeat-containing protein n=2 Tax=Lachnobacterium bovis TaxID=140626 RepID=A0A1H9U4G3_9FIRM|nr:tetratricopeptide repeat protein [Lachnobacterium bovis]SES04385.1 Tetratricopeptide repeat-containing protein [Lachnobacterium bovis]
MKRMRNKILAMLMTSVTVVSVLGGCGRNESKQTTFKQYGINALENGQYKEAIKSLNSALNQANGKVGKNEVEICYYKAEAQYLSGDIKGALKTYTALIDYDNNEKAYYLRGNVYLSQSKTKKAFSDYKKALEENENDYELYIGIYNSLADDGEEKEAKEYLKKALKIDKDKAYDKMQKGRIYYLLEKKDKAISLLNEAIDDGQKDAYFYLGDIYAESDKKSNKEKANNYFKKHMEESDLTSEEYYRFGKSLMKEDKYCYSLSYFLNGLKLEEVPNKQALMKKAISAYEHTSDFKAAKELMKKYVESYPSDEAAKSEYVFLKTR